MTKTKKVLAREVECEGIAELLGERITLFCWNYIYTGKLVAVNGEEVTLEDPAIVYETGPFNEKNWKDAQSLPEKQWTVCMQAVESYGVMK
jgi:hypothetical protein